MDYMQERVAAAEARGDADFTADQIALARRIARHALDAAVDGNDAGMAWHGTGLLMEVGERRARILLGKRADAVLASVPR